jgi:hypothetical protein
MNVLHHLCYSYASSNSWLYSLILSDVNTEVDLSIEGLLRSIATKAHMLYNQFVLYNSVGSPGVPSLGCSVAPLRSARVPQSAGASLLCSILPLDSAPQSAVASSILGLNPWVFRPVALLRTDSLRYNHPSDQQRP